MSQLASDLRLAVRALGRRPGLTAVAVTTLALGIGANTAIFSAIERVLLEPPPVADPDRVVLLWSSMEGQEQMPVALPDLVEWRQELGSLSALAAYRGTGFALGGDGAAAERVDAAMVSADFFTTLGLEPRLGNLFAPAAGAPPAGRLIPIAGGDESVAILGHDLWQRRFGGDPAIVGRTIRLDREPYTVVGVLETDDLRLPSWGTAEVWVPLARFEEQLLTRDLRSNTLGIGRLAPGVSVGGAAAELAALAAEQERRHPENNVGVSAGLALLQDRLVREARPILLIVQGVVLLVLAIACVNLANLLLVRTHARRQELAVRRAMGAGRGRLVRQLLAESVVLGLAGGGVGVLVGWWGIVGLEALGGEGTLLADLTLDGRVLAVATGLSILAGLAAGLLPALAAGRTADPLSGGTRTAGGDLGGRRLRQGLVALQLALALVLLIGAGLMLRSLEQVLAVDLGFDGGQAMTAEIALPEASYDPPRAKEFFRRLEERLAARPEIERVALVDPLPLSGSASASSLEIEGYTPPDGRDPSPRYAVVSPGYFRTMEIERLAGRGFTAADRENATRVIVVDRLFAERFWPGEDAVGRRARWGDEWVTVVGVVEPVRYLRPDEEPQPQFYAPAAQSGILRADVVVRGRDAGASALALREEVAALDPALPVHDLTSLPEVVGESFEQHRTPALLLSLFALVALALAALGTYGVISYSVVRRTREIGVRMALGAGRREVLAAVMGEGLRLVVLGVAVGLAGGWGLARLLSSVLYHVSPVDPVSYLAVTALLAAVATLACWLPAQRAAAVDPLTALRWE